MRQLAWATFFFLLFHLFSFAGTKEEKRPDREMLKLMELLRDWEMFKNLDLMRQLDSTEPASGQGSPKVQQGKTKDRQK